MTKLYRTTDKITIKVDQLTIKISPLSKRQKMSLQNDMIKASNGDLDAGMEAISNAIRYSLKDIKGVTVEDEEGNDVPYMLEFGDDNYLTDECVDDLLNLPESQKINGICSGLIAGPPSGQIVDGEGKPLEGVKIITKKGKPGKK